MACNWRYTTPSLMNAPLCGTHVRVCAMYPFYFDSRVCMLPVVSGAGFSFFMISLELYTTRFGMAVKLRILPGMLEA